MDEMLRSGQLPETELSYKLEACIVHSRCDEFFILIPRTFAADIKFLRTTPHHGQTIFQYQ